MTRRVEVLAIGGSAGSIGPISTLLASLAGAQVAVLVVIHVPADPPSLLVSLFAERCPLLVVEAVDKAPLQAGVVHIAPADYHLLAERDRSVALSRDPAVNYSRPAIDLTFEAIADVYGAGAVAVLMSGASADGAAGLAAVVRAGGQALIHEPSSARSPEMPRAGLRAAPDAIVGTAAELAAWLGTHVPRGAAHG